MRVPLLAAVLVAVFLFFAPSRVHAGPIVTAQTFENPLGTTTLAAQFTFDNDIALFRLVFGEGIFTLTGSSTSAAAGFDPILALFAADGSPVPYLTADGGESTSPSIGEFDADVVLPIYTLAGATTYTLAVSQFGPAVPNSPKGSLADGFEMDAFPCFTIDLLAQCEAGDPLLFGGQSGTFSFELTVTAEDSAPVPEPGTLGLMLLGSAGYAFVRRRPGKTRSQI